LLYNAQRNNAKLFYNTIIAVFYSAKTFIFLTISSLHPCHNKWHFCFHRRSDNLLSGYHLEIFLRFSHGNNAFRI